MKDLIQKLVTTIAPSGFEDPVRNIIRPEIEAFADEISVDALGNLIALKKGDGTGLKVMLAAHMDEIGIMASHITKEGFVHFTNIGFVYPHLLWGNRVQFANGVVGVVHSARIDISDFHKVHPLNKHFIDVGASSKEDCPVSVGEPAAFTRGFIDNGKRLISKSMDDRIGCVVAMEALKRLKKTPHEVYFVFSVQEEVGVRGALTAANAIEPDVGIAIDVTVTGDVPEARTVPVSLGKGAAIKVKDAGMIAHAGLVRLMRKRAEDAGIAHQLEVMEMGSTDARSMQVAGPGSAAGCISIPTRYIHSQSETVDIDDVESCIQLLVEILAKPIEL